MMAPTLGPSDSFAVEAAPIADPVAPEASSDSDAQKLS